MLIPEAPASWPAEMGFRFVLVSDVDVITLALSDFDWDSDFGSLLFSAAFKASSLDSS